MPVTPVHKADTSSVPIGSNSERSAFRHVFVKHRKMSACVCVGVRQMLEYETLGEAYGRYLFSHLCCRQTPSTAVRLQPLQPPHCTAARHCCRRLLPCTLCCRRKPPLSATVLPATPPPHPPTATTFHPPLRRTR